MEATLSVTDSPEARSKPPEVQDLLERSVKKYKRDATLMLATDVEHTQEALMEETAVPENSNLPTMGNYKERLMNFDLYSKEDPHKKTPLVDDTIVDIGNPDCPRIILSEDEKERIRRPWRRSLILRLLGKTVGYNYLLRRLQALWKPEAGMELIDLDQDYYLARFELQRDYDVARFEGPWMILDHYLIVQQWVPNFNTRTNNTEKILAWIRLPAIPMEYFDEKILMSLGSAIGRPVKIDTTTNLASRGKFARICVEIDISKPLLAKFEIEEETYPIEYEGVHLICFKCGVYGHRKEHCGQEVKNMDSSPENQMETDEGKMLEEKSETITTIIRKTAPPRVPVDEKFGSWMIATRKERRPPRQGYRKDPGGKGSQQQLNSQPRIQTETKNQSIHNNPLFNSRFAPLRDMEEEQPDIQPSSIAQTSPRLLGETSTFSREEYDPAKNVELQPSSSENPMRVSIPRRSNLMGRGDRLATPRKAAAEDEHVLVRGSTKGKAVLRTTVHHRPKDPGIRSPPLVGSPPPNLHEEGIDFFDCDTPKEFALRDEILGGQLGHDADSRMLS